MKFLKLLLLTLASFTQVEAQSVQPTRNAIAFDWWMNGVTDNVAPGLNITENAPTIIPDLTLPTGVFTATFTLTENSTTFAIGDISVTNGAASAFGGSGASYTATITPDFLGDVGIIVNAGTFTDAAGNANTVSNSVTVTVDMYQYQLDQVWAFSDVVYSSIRNSLGAGGAFRETAMTNPVIDGDDIVQYKGSGNNPFSVPNLTRKGGTDMRTQKVWPNSLQSWAQFNRKWAKAGAPNGIAYDFYPNATINTPYYESDPGSPGTGTTQLGGPYHSVAWYWYMDTSGEEQIDFWRQQSSFIRYTGGSSVKAAGVNWRQQEGHINSYKFDAAGNYEMEIVQSVGTNATSGTTANHTATSGEMIRGKNGHPMAVLTGPMFISKQVGGFTAPQLTQIKSFFTTWYTVTATPPWPKYPDSYENVNANWDNTLKRWCGAGSPLTGFVDGTGGTIGTPEIIWYYFRRDGGWATLLPINNVLENYFQVPSSMDCTTIGAGDAVSSVQIDGVEILGSTINFATSASATTQAIATAINAFQTTFFAFENPTVTGVLLIHPILNTYRPMILTHTVSGFTPVVINAPRSATYADGSAPSAANQYYFPRTLYDNNGQIIDGVAGTSVVSMFRTITPINNSGVRGPTIRSQIIIDNIPDGSDAGSNETFEIIYEDDTVESFEVVDQPIVELVEVP